MNILTPSMIPFIRARVAVKQTAMAAAATGWALRRATDAASDRLAYNRVNGGIRRTAYCDACKVSLAAATRESHIHAMFRYRRPDLECIFARHPEMAAKLGSNDLLLMWLPPAEVAMARLAGWEVHRG